MLKMNKLYIILIISLLFLISLTAVSANDTPVVVDGDNFTALNKTISEYDNIELGNDIIVADEEISYFLDPSHLIVIDKNMTINGKNFSIDARNKLYNIFWINDSITLTLKDITLKNIYDVCDDPERYDKGSAIHINSDKFITVNLVFKGNVNFKNNHIGQGIDINVKNADLNINVTNDSYLSFDNSSCFLEEGGGFPGCPIYCRDKSNLIINNYGDIVFSNIDIRQCKGEVVQPMFGIIGVCNGNCSILGSGNMTFINNTAFGGIINIGIKSPNDAGLLNILGSGNINFINNKVGNGFLPERIQGLINVYKDFNCNMSLSFIDNEILMYSIYDIYAKGNIIINSSVLFNDNFDAIRTEGYLRMQNAIFSNPQVLGVVIGDWNNSNIDNNYWGFNYQNNQSIFDKKLIGTPGGAGIPGDIVAPKWWVLLNVTVPDKIIVGDNNVFNLVFNKRTNGTIIEDYNNLTISTKVRFYFNDGMITQYTFAPGTFNVTPLKTGQLKIDILNYYYSNILYTVYINVLPTDSILKVFVDDITYGDTAKIRISLIGGDNKTITGDVNLKIGGITKVVSVNNGIGTVDIKNLNANTYNVIAKYNGDATYKNVTNTTSFKVAKKEISLDVNNLVIIVGESDNLTIAASEVINGTVTVKYDGKTKPVNITNGVGTLEIDDLTSTGIYPVTVSLNNNVNYVARDVNATIYVVEPGIKESIDIFIDASNIVYGENTTVNIELAYANGTSVESNVRFVLYKDGVEIKSFNRTVSGYDSFELSNLDSGVYVIGAYIDETLFIKSSFNNTNFNVSKIATNLNIQIDVIKYGETGILNIIMNQKIDANVTIYIDGGLYLGSVSLIDGVGQFYLKNINAGDHVLMVRYDGDKNYMPSRTVTSWSVEQIVSNLVLDVDDIVYGETGVLDISLDPKLNTTVELFVDGNRFVDGVDLINGHATIDLKNFNAGKHIITVKYAGDINRMAKSATIAWTVEKIMSNLVINIDDIVYGETGVLDISLDPKLNTTVELFVDGNRFVDGVELVDGHATIDLTNIGAGKHIITVKYAGDVNHMDKIARSVWTVEKAETSLIINTEDIYYGQKETIIVNVGNNLSGLVIISGLFENEIKFNVVDGVGSAVISNLAPAVYTINALFIPINSNYNIALATSSFNVTDGNIYIKIDDLKKIYGDDNKFEALLIDGEGCVLKNTTVVFTINGVSYDRITDEEGKAYLNINLAPGEYPIKVTYMNTEAYATIYVITTIQASDISLMYKNGTKYEAIFTDCDGNALANTNVTFNINGVFYTKTTDNEGKASLTINLLPGEYIITAYNPVTKESHSNKVTVRPILVGDDLIKAYDIAATYDVKAFDNEGNPLAGADITININGVFYTKTTDDNGIARLNINLLPGEYIATAYYNGFATSNKITVLGA